MSEYDAEFRELDWDDEIENSGNPFVVLREGDYGFQVEKFERGRFQGSDKIPPCNKAVLTLTVTSEHDKAVIKTDLILYSKLEWKLHQFFISIGHGKKGEPMKMNWSIVPGATGRCKLGIREWIGRDGTTKQNNEVQEFYAPKESAANEPVAANTEAPGGFTPGRF